MANRPSETRHDIEDLVRRYFAAYESGDRAVLDGILSENFTFRGPLDEPPVDRSVYFERCWPASAKIKRVEIRNVFVDGDEAAVRYVTTLTSGAQYRCTEWFRIEGGHVAEVDVYIGNTPDYLFKIFGVAD